MKQHLIFHKIITLLALLLLFTNAHAQNFNARLEWVHTVELRMLDNGVIQKVNARLGQHVKKGAMLVTMDQREFQAKVQKTTAEVEQSKLKLNDAADDLERTQELFDRGLIANEELKHAKLTHIAANAALQSSKASQVLAKIALERSSLRAPISGIIVKKNAWEGGVVYKTLQKEPLIAIAPNGSMLARVLINSQTLQRYKPGQNARVMIRGKNYSGKIYSLGVEAVRIDPSGAVYELDIIFNHAANETLRPSQTVKVILP